MLCWRQKNITISDYVEKHYGIKADEIMYTAINIPNKRNFKKDYKRILYVGRLDEDTGLRKILKSLSGLKGYKIDFCGDGPLAEECNKYGKVHGFVDPRPFFEKAFICMSPGHTSILEAFSYKCYVITTYNNIVKKDYLLMTPFAKWMSVCKAPEEMTKKIKLYSNTPSLVKKKIEAAYKWVLTQNWEHYTDVYLKLWGAK